MLNNTHSSRKLTSPGVVASRCTGTSWIEVWATVAEKWAGWVAITSSLTACHIASLSTGCWERDKTENQIFPLHPCHHSCSTYSENHFDINLSTQHKLNPPTSAAPHFAFPTSHIIYSFRRSHPFHLTSKKFFVVPKYDGQFPTKCWSIIFWHFRQWLHSNLTNIKQLHSPSPGLSSEGVWMHKELKSSQQSPNCWQTASQ